MKALLFFGKLIVMEREIMVFQRKVDRAMKKLHEDSDAGRAERGLEPKDGDEREVPELEKNDLLAMVIAAMITIVRVALLVLVGFGLVIYFSLIH